MNDFEVRSLYDQVQAMEVKIKALEVLLGESMSEDEVVAEEELVEEEAEEEAVEEVAEEEAEEEMAEEEAEEEADEDEAAEEE
jgi:hypothetical protein